MLRPSTARRNAAGTLRVLGAIRGVFGARVEIHTFGCGARELRAFRDAALTADLRASIVHHGELARDAVADLFASSDVFLDMSHWQAWGRTGLEAMAAGCVPVLPKGSGSEEYARDDVNAKLADTSDAVDAVAAVAHLVRDAAHRRRLRKAGIKTAGKFDLASASLTLLTVLCDRLDDPLYSDAFLESPCRVDDGLDLDPRAPVRAPEAPDP